VAGRGAAALKQEKVRPWISFASSATLHILIVALVVWLSHVPDEGKREDKRESRAAPKREVQMVYLKPPPTPPPPAAPPPEKAQRTPEPEANAPPEAKRSEGAEPTDKPKAPERSGRPDAAPPTSPLATNEATMESEAKRIFGTPKKFTPEGVGPQRSRPMEAYLPDHPERCTPVQPTDSAGQPRFGTVVGKIYRQDNGKPLAGAHLQMLGTPYVTFTDDEGVYHFRFDLSLVDNCRTQYVRVTAAGYESRLLVLIVGTNAVSEDVTLRKK
jgi:hypothetical protein